MLGSILDAQQTFANHDFSRGFSIRILDINGAPDYVKNELLYAPAGQGGAVYANSIVVPGKTITDIPLVYQGFTYHIPGMVQYEPNPWTITFKTPGDYLVRNAFERWMNEIVSDETTCGSSKFPCPNVTLDIGILSPNCEIERIYQLIGLYPQSVGQIQYDLTSNEIVTFDVSLHYQRVRIKAVNDTPSIDIGTTDDQDSVYQSYESAILANNNKTCGIK